MDSVNTKIFCFDLDGTLCSQIPIEYYLQESPDECEKFSAPLQDRIDIVNKLYDYGHTIIIETARASHLSNKREWRKMTVRQLKKWNIKYHKLRVGHKIVADIYVDDRGQRADNFFL